MFLQMFVILCNFAFVCYPRDQLLHQYDGGSGLDFITLSSDFARDAKQCNPKGGGGGLSPS